MLDKHPTPRLDIKRMKGTCMQNRSHQKGDRKARSTKSVSVACLSKGRHSRPIAHSRPLNTYVELCWHGVLNRCPSAEQTSLPQPPTTIAPKRADLNEKGSLTIDYL